MASSTEGTATQSKFETSKSWLLMERLLILLILFLLGTYHPFKAQTRKDSMKRKMNRQYKHKILGISESGKWAMVAKYYDLNRDTTMVVNSSVPNAPLFTITGMNQFKSFLKDEAIIAFGNKKAEYTSLKTLEKIIYDHVKHIYVLTATGQYAILNESDVLDVFNFSGQKLYTLDAIKNLPISDQHGKSFVYRKNREGYEIIDISGTAPKGIYNTQNVISHIEVSKSGNFVIVVETKNISFAENLVFIDIKNGMVSRPNINSQEKDAYLGYTEIGNGSAWLLNVNRKIFNNGIVDIWYGNDGNLNNKDRGYEVVSEYSYYDIEAEETVTLYSNTKNTILPTGNDRFLLLFNEGELQNYTSLAPDINLKVYDILTKKTAKLDTIKGATLAIPSTGNSILYRAMNNDWVLADLQMQKKTVIENSFLQEPTFTSDGKTIYFESNQGLFSYDIQKKILTNTGIGKYKLVRIVNKLRTNLAGSYLNINTSQVTATSPILVEVKDQDENTMTYVTLFKNKKKVVIPETPNKIRELYYTQQVDKVWYSSENYNSPTAIYFLDRKKSTSKLIVPPNKNDLSVRDLKLEIIHFQNSEGKKLNGLLYYPAKFDPLKKYPVIVRIYQVQNNLSNEYQVIGYDNPVGFDIRALVERGYFVYLPDIVFGKQGTGLSALDCINSSMNAILGRNYLDASKIGLIGHSHGGYETNFIATHSDRFAAYISGAGNSDIVRSYFSYNSNFHSPFYWQYENGQYEMPSSLSANKELYFKNNPIHYVNKVNAPILIWAGKKDENIKWDQTLEFYVGLKRNNKNVIALFYPNQGHALGLGTPERIDLYERVFDWWDYHLKGIKVPWIDLQIKKDAL
ncbi:MAG: S9 family peptidase [Sphingobacteriaceae bacterium]|nr:S9 family peptidase [Sphingobacteriaceae bacterium]